jgi:hypothetical protein
VPVNEGEAIVALNAISEIFVVILEVFEAIKVGKVPMVDAVTPPTELIVVGKVAVPDPLTSPVNVIN